jgi:hypothetical protein
MQSKLEKVAIDKREEDMAKSEYNIVEPYSTIHTNAISDGDTKGKGTNHGGHTHFLPDKNKPSTTIDYSNFDTKNGGNTYDIEGRNNISGRKRLTAYSLYNKDYSYGAHLINTEENQRNGQYRV